MFHWCRISVHIGISSNFGPQHFVVYCILPKFHSTFFFQNSRNLGINRYYIFYFNKELSVLSIRKFDLQWSSYRYFLSIVLSTYTSVSTFFTALMIRSLSSIFYLTHTDMDSPNPRKAKVVGWLHFWWKRGFQKSLVWKREWKKEIKKRNLFRI